MGKGKSTGVLQVIKSTLKRFLSDDCSRLAAALSFYTLFSLAPLLLIVVAIVGFIYGTEAIQGNIVKQLSGFIGEKSAFLVQDLIISISRPSSSFIASAIAVFLSLYGASHVFNHLNISISRIWNISTGSGLSLKHLLIRKFFLMILVIATGLFFLLSLLTGSLLNYFAGFLPQTIPLISVFLEMMNTLLSLGTTILAFVLIYKYLPDVRTAWEPVIVGSILSASLFFLSRLIIVLYLRFSIYSSVYNAAASLIILLIWLYYSSQILFLGAEFIYIYANLCGKPIRSSTAE
ncbi:MAG: YihY/virulence factor BrkB family protein [Fibrobacter sp.]|jgi:membrane protein|nr:YihY/virulence factor BrkB family protein [Fibrobacter sp.]